jgi:hypothetical protein
MGPRVTANCESKTLSLSSRRSQSSCASNLIRRWTALERSTVETHLRQISHASVAIFVSGSSIRWRRIAHPCRVTPISARRLSALRRRRTLDGLSRLGTGSCIIVALSNAPLIRRPKLRSAVSAVKRLASSSKAAMSAGIASALPEVPNARITPVKWGWRASRKSSAKTCGSWTLGKARAAALITASSPTRSTGSAINSVCFQKFNQDI